MGRRPYGGLGGSGLRPLQVELAGRFADGLDGGTSSEFQEKYGQRPDLFVQDCIVFPPGERPADYQQDILRNFYPRRRTAVRGPHGLGKSTLASWIVLWAVLTADDVKVITTASAWAQLNKYLWPEIHKWALKLRWDVIGRRPFSKYELQQRALKLGGTIEGFAIAPANSVFIEGAHAQRILFVFDEAKAIPDATWDAAEGAFSNAWGNTGNEALALAISTPGDVTGRFYDICRRSPGLGEWTPIHVTKAQAIKAGRMTEEWAEERRKQWGETDYRYINRVLGDFAAQQESGVIPLDWLEAAHDRWYGRLEEVVPDIYERRLGPAEIAKALAEGMFKPAVLGADIAISGDKTVFAYRYTDDIIGWIEPYQPSDVRQAIPETVGEIRRILTAYPGMMVIPDADGVGAGVAHQLYLERMPVVPFHAAHQSGRIARDTTGFINDRAAAWWGLRERLDPSYGPVLALPDDAILTGDLTAPKYWRTAGDKIQVQPKDELRTLLGRSTDYADAVIMSLWQERTSDGGIHL